MKGAEIQVRYQPNHKTLVTGHYGYRDVDGEHISSYEPVFGLSTLSEHGPRHTTGLLLNQKLTHSFDASLNAYHMTDADWKDGNEVDQFVRIDAQLRFNFSIGSTQGSIILIGQNLGEDYMEHGENNVFESRYYLKVTLDLP